MAQVSIPTLNTKVSIGSATLAPVAALASVSSNQVPVFIDHVKNVTVGEEPVYLVHMKDGTWAYIKQSLLTQSGGTVVI